MKQGLQADFGAVSYAGGMILKNNIAYITGQVGAYNCFVGAVSTASAKMQFISKQLIEGAICQTLALDVHNRLLLVATAEEGGLFTETRPIGSTKAAQYGLIAPLLFTGDGATATLMPGLLMHDDVVQYPKALVLDPNHENFAYVASMHSESGQENTHTTIDTEPNFTNLRKFGSSYFVMIQRIMMDESYRLKKGSWQKEYAVTPTPGGNEEEVIVSNMLWNRNSLVMVGYTKGAGDAFNENPNGFVTGFITRFNPEDGRVMGSPRRISFGETEDSFLYDACTSDNDADAIYLTVVTGTTITIAKLNADTLATEWQSVVSTSTSATEVTCRVDDGKGVVYMAGVVTDGGSIENDLTHSTTTRGKDDIFVTQLDTSDGSPTWMKQFGTTQNDRISEIQVLPDTNGILLFGDSSGSVMAEASGHKNAIWLVHVPFNDAFPETTEVSKIGNTGGNVAIAQPLFDSFDVGNPSPTQSPVSSVSDPSTSSSEDGGSFPDEVLMGLGIATVVVLIVILVVVLQSRRQRERVTERALVFSYLQAFEPEDVDVRNSATGGWHGTYVGKLAHGRKKNTSHSSIVKDSLFVDYDLGTPAEPVTRTPRRNFVIGDDDDDDGGNTSSPSSGDDEGDYELDAVDIRIENGGKPGGKPWGKEIV